MMKLLLLFSYFTDGFAYAGEAMTGKYIGAGDKAGLRATVNWTFIWSMGIAVAFVFIYMVGGRWMLGLMTSDRAVLEVASGFLPWLLLMPLVGCPAFTWDGIYIGATASREMRNSTLWAVLAFFAVYYLGILIQSSLPTGCPLSPETIKMHILMTAYFAHLLARTLYLTLLRRKIL